MISHPTAILNFTWKDASAGFDRIHSPHGRLKVGPCVPWHGPPKGDYESPSRRGGRGREGGQTADPSSLSHAQSTTTHSRWPKRVMQKGTPSTCHRPASQTKHNLRSGLWEVHQAGRKGEPGPVQHGLEVPPDDKRGTKSKLDQVRRRRRQDQDNLCFLAGNRQDMVEDAAVAVVENGQEWKRQALDPCRR